MIQYSDFTCRHCGSFALDTLPAINQRYVDKGLVRLAFRPLPLQRRHPLAFKAAEAAICSARQNRFWEMHDALFSRPLEPPLQETINARAKGVGLEMSAFESCLSGEVIPQIRRDIEEARRLRLAGTPSFVFGTIDQHGKVLVERRETGALDLEAFERILDSMIDRNGRTP